MISLIFSPNFPCADSFGPSASNPEGFTHGAISVALGKPESYPLKVNRIKFAVTRIASLLTSRRPSDVSRFVTTKIIDPIYRMIDWLRSYVQEEGHEIMSPFGADKNSSSSVTFEVLVSGVMTPRNHALPTNIFSSSCSPVALRHTVVYKEGVPSLT